VADRPGTDGYLTRLAHSMADTLITPHVTARSEVMSLVEGLKLPRGRRRAAARAEWFAATEKPLEVHDIIGETPQVRPQPDA
jgi:hypothetical protein